MARRTQEETVEETGVSLHPKCNERLVAHAAQEQRLLAMFNHKRLPHALLFTGQKGIGKATLAYRLARFLLAPQESGGGLFGDALPPESLHIAAAHPTFRRVVSGGHPDMLVLEGDDIKIEDARKVPEFLSMTPAEGDWRVVIIDSAEAMNRNAANALLKTLEEPPSQAVIILVSHNPGELLPTIRSRCRVLRIPRLNEEEFAAVMLQAAPEVDRYDYGKWALLSGYSPGVALALVKGRADALYEELLERVTVHDTVKLHAFADRFARKDAESDWQIVKRLTLWLIARVASLGAGLGAEVFSGERAKLQHIHASKPAYFWTEIWEKTGNLFSDTERLYLDRKQAIISLMGALR
jgi:DNA polymerase-3 subunit delta'